MVNTVIFDLGGVLVDFHPRAGLESLGLSAETIEYLYQAIFTGLWESYDRVNIDEAGIRAAFKKKVPGYEREIDRLWDNISCVTAVKPWSEQWVSSLKERGLRLYVLSNFGRAAFTRNSPLYTFLRHMDGRVISYEIEEMKPEEPIYRYLLKKYDIDPGTAVFIDDRPVNIETARRLGMQGIVFENYEQAAGELEKMLDQETCRGNDRL